MLLCFVVVPVQTVVWMSSKPRVANNEQYLDGQLVQFKEGHVEFFMCQVNGSYPKPQVVIINYLSFIEF